jgi:Ca-activated chloride channel homolog
VRFWFLLLLFPSVTLAKTETWPRLYNDGVTAYHSNDFTRAASLFESATASPDRALQQRALYNLGNTSYRLGEAKTPQAQQLWQRAIKSYESALALDPHDADAKFNHDFVEKKLEELKKQQQQQNQQNQSDKKQDQKKDNDQQQKQQQQQSPSQPQKPENQQSQEQKQQQQQSQEQQKQEQQKSDQKRKDEQQKQQAQQQKESPPEQQPQPQSGQPENDEKRQAAVLLDNLREDERNWNFFPEVQMKDLKDSGEPAKDW